jgi:uncharacterized protein YbaA (DUF1428 family)
MSLRSQDPKAKRIDRSLRISESIISKMYPFSACDREIGGHLPNVYEGESDVCISCMDPLYQTNGEESHGPVLACESCHEMIHSSCLCKFAIISKRNLVCTMCAGEKEMLVASLEKDGKTLTYQKWKRYDRDACMTLAAEMVQKEHGTKEYVEAEAHFVDAVNLEEYKRVLTAIHDVVNSAVTDYVTNFETAKKIKSDRQDVRRALFDADRVAKFLKKKQSRKTFTDLCTGTYTPQTRALAAKCILDHVAGEPNVEIITALLRSINLTLDNSENESRSWDAPFVKLLTVMKDEGYDPDDHGSLLMFFVYMVSQYILFQNFNLDIINRVDMMKPKTKLLR